jgi:hypothetical protein
LLMLYKFWFFFCFLSLKLWLHKCCETSFSIWFNLTFNFCLSLVGLCWGHWFFAGWAINVEGRSWRRWLLMTCYGRWANGDDSFGCSGREWDCKNK